ncbi:ABC transporter permease subunit [Kineococcus sp. R8]|uniref:carbohydrate ABC transporter permease n=1 Tax=Kineococcus siccus TaxID=2696567 RepID=UPI00141306D2|nr:sugar ABC transporter permease [Kineococcus siccus]NAZ84129.1 ABC transporter permease subunit [Kineococcus siccus]
MAAQGVRRAPAPPVDDRQRARARRRETLAKWLFVVPAALYLLLFFGYPIVKNITMSFQEYTTRTFYTGEAPWVGLANYAAVLGGDLFGKALWNTALFTVGSLAGQFVIGLALASFFHRSFPLSGFLRSLLLLPWLLPLVVSGTMWRWMLDQDSGVINRILGSPVPWLSSTTFALLAVVVVNIWVGIPFNTTLLYGGLKDIPQELYEASSLDGAGPVATFRYITWPMLRPVVAVTLLLGIVYTLKVLDVILVLTGGGPANATQTIATQSYFLSFQQFEFGRGAAMGNVLIVISLVFSVLYLRANRRAAA